ncbi:MAG TPA: hypothetical protein VIH66_04320, partial [Gammaproteobacteria bacterium]
VWTSRRTQAQIQANKGIEILGSESGLVGYWRMDENSGTVVYDATSNHYDGTLVNGPVWATSVVSASSSGGGGGGVEPLELLVLAAFGFGLLIVVRRPRKHGGLMMGLVASLVMVGAAGVSSPVRAAGGFTFNFNTPLGDDARNCSHDSGCEAMGNHASSPLNYTNAGAWEMEMDYATVNINGKLYWHYVNVDPSQGFAYEIYVEAGSGFVGDMGDTRSSYEYGVVNFGNAADPLDSDWVFTGNGTGNPRGAAMRMLITEPSDDAESPYAYSFYSDFVKDDTTRKPRIEQQVNPSSDENSEIVMHFVADMRGVAYGDKSTDISNDPLHYTNTLLVLDPVLEGAGDFNVGTGAQDPFVTAGRFTVDTLYNPDGYSYWKGDFNVEPSWGAIFKHPGYLP